MISSEVPFHDPVDLLICGSTLPACELAAKVSRSGLKVLLAMERTNPYPEAVGSLRSWYDRSILDQKNLPEVVAALLARKQNWEIAGSRLYFNPATAIDLIEAQLEESGVHFFYNLAPALALGNRDHCSGVVVGGKTGLFGIQANVVVDATLSGTVGKLFGCPTAATKSPCAIHLCVELKSPRPPRQLETNLRDFHCRMEVHHRYAEFRLTPSKEMNFKRNELMAHATAALL
ncbi:MAG: FAD-dependent oxidoreductase, partial [Spirochaetia bacterium]|nr:FAD-dependent oxidoreductase [Spirochaetia bacterium]